MSGLFAATNPIGLQFSLVDHVNTDSQEQKYNSKHYDKQKKKCFKLHLTFTSLNSLIRYTT